MKRGQLSQQSIIVLMMGVVLGLAWPSPARAHYCSNIFVGPARLVVKAEQSTVQLSGSPTELRVFLQNNFPYKLSGVKMRGASNSYTISVTPGEQDVNPGQNVVFTFTISAGSGEVAVSALDLQVKFRLGSYRGQDDKLVNQEPSQEVLLDAVWFGSSGEQSPSLAAATLFDRAPAVALSAGAPFFGRTGAEALILWFGYRFCFNSGGDWRCGDSQNCPSPCAEGTAWSSIEQFPQNCMRAGVDLGIRRAQLGSHLQAARDGAVNAMKGGSEQHKCLAAVVGGLLWQGAPATDAFENALGTIPEPCKQAGLRALGKGSSGSCDSGAYYERAACAAAEGIQNNDGPVQSVLMAKAGDGDYEGLFNSYMLYLVTGHRYAQGQAPSYYPSVSVPWDMKVPDPVGQEAGPSTHDRGPLPDGYIPSEAGSVPTTDGNGTAQHAGGEMEGGCGCTYPDTPLEHGAALFLLLALLICYRSFCLYSRRRRS